LTRIVNIAQKQTQVFISEFGSKTDDDLTQAVDFAKNIRFFKSIGLKDCVAWMWRADHDSPNPSPPGFDYNLAKSINANPRPAFYIMNLTILQANYVLHVNTLGSGVTNATGVHSFRLDDKVSITATENPNWVFSHWIINVIPYNNTNPFVFYMFRNYSVTATFHLSDIDPR